jgi:hypothetical protein
MLFAPFRLSALHHFLISQYITCLIRLFQLDLVSSNCCFLTRKWMSFVHPIDDSPGEAQFAVAAL